MEQHEYEHEVGIVVKAKRYLATIEGLPSARVNDIIINQDGKRAIVRALSDDFIYALTFDGDAQLGDRFEQLPSENVLSCGPHLFGRIIDAFGRPIDNKGSFPKPNIPLKLEVEAPGVEVREPISRQFETGVTTVDTLIPIAKGQRQLVFGPIRSGKSTFLTQTIQAQADTGVVCIYAVIGKPINGLRKISDRIINAGSVKNKTIVVSGVSDLPPAAIAITPSVAFALAEYFQKQGEDVLVVLDDLDSHAKYLREIALLEGRLPSVESYPGDIFYQHAHLMERSGEFTKAHGGGSITTLPVIQTDQKNFSDLIPTNVMACTDGHLSFVPQLRAEGVYPSISIEESVTRVGRQAQKTLQKQATRYTQMLLGEYRAQKEYAQFGADLNERAREVLRKGSVAELLLQQPPYKRRDIMAQVIALGLVFSGYFDDKKDIDVKSYREALYATLTTHPELASVREMTRNDAVGWDVFLQTLKRNHAKINSYVSHS